MAINDFFSNDFIYLGFLLGASCVAAIDIVRYAAKGAFRILKYFHTFWYERLHTKAGKVFFCFLIVLDFLLVFLVLVAFFANVVS